MGIGDRSITRALAATGKLGTKPVLPGFEITRIKTQLDGNERVTSESITQQPSHGDKPFEVGERRHIGKITSHVINGNVHQEWVRTNNDQFHPEDVAEMLLKHFSDYKTPHRIVLAPAPKYLDRLALLPLADLHKGLYCWHGDTRENWDLKIDEEVVGTALERLIAMTPACEEMIILGGGDAMHSDTNQNMTLKSHNILQVDGRYDKVLGKTCEFFVYAGELALRKFGRVHYRILKGNHDEHSAVAIAYFLKAFFRNDPRVIVDVDASLFWFHRYGKVFLGATHGHAAKPKDMPMIMAGRNREDWGRSDHSYVHMFHVHHNSKLIDTVGSVVVETHEAPVPPDAYHFGAGYQAGRSLQTIIYDKDTGEIARIREPIRARKEA